MLRNTRENYFYEDLHVYPECLSLASNDLDSDRISPMSEQSLAGVGALLKNSVVVLSMVVITGLMLWAPYLLTGNIVSHQSVLKSIISFKFR